MKDIVKEEFYHVPDLQFLRWCEQCFAINRGVYNIIDEKLYEQGLQDVTERRKAIVQFLSKHVLRESNQKFYKFGPGKLAEALASYTATAMK